MNASDFSVIRENTASAQATSTRVSHPRRSSAARSVVILLPGGGTLRILIDQ
jgi:hypothetical protein